MDPGNWATDLEGGARFGYHLLWVLVMSNLMAILLQTLSARLGIVSGRDSGAGLPRDVPDVYFLRTLDFVRNRHCRLRSGGSTGARLSD